MRERALCLALFVLPCIALPACQREERPRPAVVRTSTGIWVARTVLHPAEAANFNYLNHLSRAEAGDEEALTGILAFSPKLSGAALRIHGGVLLELLARTGDAVFAAAAATLDGEARTAVSQALDFGIRETRKPILSQPLAQSFPATAAALGMTEI